MEENLKDSQHIIKCIIKMMKIKKVETNNNQFIKQTIKYLWQLNSSTSQHMIGSLIMMQIMLKMLIIALKILQLVKPNNQISNNNK